MKNKTPTPPNPSVRQLDTDELDAIVGGVTSGADRKRLVSLVHDDLLSTDAAHDHTADIAAMIASGAVTAKETISLIEMNAGHDGQHSGDGQLADVHAALKAIGAAAAGSEFAQEESKRVGNGAAAADLGRLINSGALSGTAAVSILQDEARLSGSNRIGAAMAGLETASHGNAAVESTLGHLVASGRLAAGDAVAAVEAGAAVDHKSIDQALSRLDAAAGGNAAIEAEEHKRVQSGAAATNLADAMSHGTITGAQAAAALAAEVAHGAITGAGEAAVLMKLEKTVKGDAGLETELGHLVKSGQVSAADAIAAVELGAKAAHKSIDQALNRLDAGAGGNRIIETEDAKRVHSGAATVDLANAMRQGTLTGAEAAAVLAAEVARHAIKGADEAAVVMKLERIAKGDAGLEAELGRLVKSGQVSATAAIAAVEAGETAGHKSVDQALTRLDKGAGGNSSVEAEEAKRVRSGATATDLARAISHGTLTGADAAAVLGAEVTGHAITAAEEAAVLMKLERTMKGDAALETALGHLVKTGQASSAEAIAAVEAGAAAGHKSVDQALMQLHAGTGDNKAVEAEEKKRIESGAAAADLAGGVAAGSMTADAALQFIQAEGQQSHTSAGSAIASLEGAMGGNATVEAALAQLIAGGTDVGAAIQSLEKGAQAAHQSIDLALLSLDRAVNGNGQIEAELAARFNSGQTVADLSTLVTSGAAPIQAAVDAITAAAGFAGASPSEALLSLERTTGGNAAVENALAPLVWTGGLDPQVLFDTVSQIADQEGKSLDATLVRVAGIVGAVEPFASALFNRLTDPDQMSASLMSGIQAGTITSEDAAKTILAASQLATGSAQGLGMDKVFDLSLQLGHDYGVDKAVAAAVAAGQVSGAGAIGYVWGIADRCNQSVPSELFRFDGFVPGGIPEVEQELANQAVSEYYDSQLGNIVTSIQRPAIVDLVLRYAASAGAPGEQSIGVIDRLASTLNANAPNTPGGPATYSSVEFLALAAQQTGSPAFSGRIADHLFDGSGEAELVAAVASGTMTAQAAIEIASNGVALVQHQGAAAHGNFLPGAAEAELVLAKLDAAAQSAMPAQSIVDTVQNAANDVANGLQDAATTITNAFLGVFGDSGGTPGATAPSAPVNPVTQLHTMLQSTYGLAISIGSVMVPLVDGLGADVANKALAAGTALAGISDPTTGQEAKTIVDLEAAAHAAGVSVDAALALASMNAVGKSEVLKIEMTDRLLSGKAEAEIAQLVSSGSISVEHGLDILANATRTLAAGSSTGSALGFDRDTAVAMVAAKLDLALRDAGVPWLQSQIEATHGKEIYTGLGVVIGLAAGSGSDPAGMAAAQTLANKLLPHVIAQQVADNASGASSSSDAAASLQQTTQQTVQSFADAYGKAHSLADFEKEWVAGRKSDGNAVSHDVSGSLQTYQFTELGVDVGVSQSVTADLGHGFSLTLAADAAAGGSISVNATQVTIQAAAEASASETLDLGGHARVVMLAQAIAAGSVTAGVTGVAIKGNIGISGSVTVSQTEQGSLGNGFEGMQTTTLTAGVVAGAEGSGALGIDNKVAFGAKAGVYAAAGEEGNVSYGGVTVGGGATVMSPGVVGYSTNVDVSFADGNINIGVSQFIGVELFGAEFKLNLTLPTGQVVDALKSLGGPLENVGNTIANNVQHSAEIFGQDVVDGLSGVGHKIASLYT